MKPSSTIVNTQAALAQYGQMQTQQAAASSPHKMIAMLFDAALESINVMLGAMAKERQDIKGKASSKAIRIINGMRELLDMSSGSELAENLYSLYSFMCSELFRANYDGDMEAVKEVRAMLKDVQESWNKMPQAQGAAEPVPSVASEPSSSQESEDEKPTVAVRKPALGLRQSAFYS